MNLRVCAELSAPVGKIDILHADAHCIVFAKPAGLPAVPGREPSLHDCAASRVQAQFEDALVVHRLDMATSGLMLMARGKASQRRLSDDFAQRRVLKRYEAVVQGLLAQDEGEIDWPLRADWPNRPRQVVDLAAGKASLTRYTVLLRDPQARTTRVALQPHTGRSHQLRVHLQALGHPILGDTLYAPAFVQALSPRLLLHACALSLDHPAHGMPLQFEHQPPF